MSHAHVERIHRFHAPGVWSSTATSLKGDPVAATVLALQRSAGNRAVVVRLSGRGSRVQQKGTPAPIQRCGPNPCDCSIEERGAAAMNSPSPGQRATEGGAQPAEDLEQASVQRFPHVVQRNATDDLADYIAKDLNQYVATNP